MAEIIDKSKKYNVPAVQTTFKILSLLSRKKYYKSTLSGIAQALELTPTSCYRILKQLEELSIVRYESSSKQYSLGPYLVVLGERAKEGMPYVQYIIPYLEALSEETGLTCALSSRIGSSRTTFIAKSEGKDFGVNISVGRHFFINDGVYGKCFLAHMDEEEVSNLLRMNKGLNPLTNDEEIENLKQEFKKIRENGYAITYNEYIDGIFGIASPILNGNKKVEMVICLFGMIAQYEKKDILPKGEMLNKVTSDIMQNVNFDI